MSAGSVKGEPVDSTDQYSVVKDQVPRLVRDPAGGVHTWTATVRVKLQPTDRATIEAALAAVELQVADSRYGVIVGAREQAALLRTLLRLAEQHD